MSRILALGGLTAILALTLTWELTMTEPDVDTVSAPQTSSPVSTSRAAMTNHAAAPPNKPPIREAEREAATIVERPLFSPGRRPPAGRASAETAAARPDSAPRLTGVIVGPDGRRAIFTGADGKSRVASAGDTVGAFRIHSIDPGLVTISGSDGRRALRPAYAKPAGTAGAPQPSDGPDDAPSGSRTETERNGAINGGPTGTIGLQGGRR